MYDFSDKKGVLFHRKCKKKRGSNRKCTTTEVNLLDNWEMFQHGKFIVIPENYCF